MQDALPPKAHWPDLLPVPGISYPDLLNASVELMDSHVSGGRGERIAVRQKGEAISYKHLQVRVQRCAAALTSAGVVPGDRVILRFPNTPDCVIARLSILHVGGVAVATMPLLRPRETKRILADSGARLAICQDQLLEESHLDSLEKHRSGRWVRD